MGIAGGWIAYWLHMPAGALVGSMVAVGALRLAGGPVQQIPVGVRRWAQVVIGAILGVSFDWSQLLVGEMLLPALALTDEGARGPVDADGWAAMSDRHATLPEELGGVHGHRRS